jgi:hypothetical protein
LDLLGPEKEPDPISDILTDAKVRSLAREAALKIVELLSLMRMSEAGNPDGFRIARELAAVAGIDKEINTRLSEIRPV